MQETSMSATLVSTRQMLASQSDGLTVTLPREEVEAALASDPPNELILDILRNVSGTDELERRTVNVAWKRSDLESVIGDGDAEAITFSFDSGELNRLLSEPDVESHGLREAAVVLSIAAAAAVGGAASASAAAHDEAGLSARGIQGTVAAVASTHDEATLAARGIEQATVAASHDEATSTARGIEPGTVAAVAATHDEATLAARGIEGTSPADTAIASSGSGFDLPSVSPTMAASIAAALGAFGLAILGASFVSRRREPGAV